MQKKSNRFNRKNLLLDEKKLIKLKKTLKSKTESEAVRLAIERTLNAENAITALKNLRKRGTWGSNLEI